MNPQSTIHNPQSAIRNPQSATARLVLGMETATFCGSVALLADDRLIGSRTLNSSATHSARLLQSIAELLAEADVPLGNVTGIAVSIGPGSFTGVRIGLSAAKGLAFAQRIPMVGVSTLEALAVRAGRDPRLICPVIDARRNETFVAAYRWPRGADLPRLVVPPGVMPIERFLDCLLAARSATRDRHFAIRNPQSAIRGRCLFLGDGALRYRKPIESRLGQLASFAPPHRILPSAEEIAWLGRRRLARGEFDDPAVLEPVYIRSSDARLPAR
jgi:tRNA threonylcarbamoyladenosine biosynthesis protein TsaB